MTLDRRTLLRATVGGAITGGLRLSGLGLSGLGLSGPGLSGPARANRRRTIYVAGDSTAATYATADVPQAGGGQALPVFLRPGISVVTQAWSGAGSKSFAALGHLDRILNAIGPGAPLLVSFGHNDEKTADPTR